MLFAASVVRRERERETECGGGGEDILGVQGIRRMEGELGFFFFFFDKHKGAILTFHK